MEPEKKSFFSYIVAFLKAFLPIVILVGALFFSYLLLVGGPKQAPKPQSVKLPPVEYLSVSPDNISIPVFTRGIVQPETEIQLTSQVNGVIKRISSNFTDGGYFKKGDILVQIDQAALKADAAQAKAQYATALQASELAKARVKNRRNITVDGVRRSTRFATGELKLLEANANLEAAKATYDLAKAQLKNAIIRAPFTGRVKRRVATKNEVVVPGKPLAQIYATNTAKVRLPLSSRQMELIDVPKLYEDYSEKGSTGPLVILSDTQKKFSWHGYLTGVEGTIDPRNRLIYVLADVDAPYAKDELQPNRPPLSSGAYVEAMIQGREHRNVVILPRDAVHNRNEVWVLNDEDRISIRKVGILYRGKDSIYVNRGLINNDRVVVTPLEVVVENMRVHVTGSQDSPESPIKKADQQPELEAFSQ